MSETRNSEGAVCAPAANEADEDAFPALGTAQPQLADLPEPIYSCADPNCAVEVSYPADMLRWLPSVIDAEGHAVVRPGWYCENCIDELAPIEALPDTSRAMTLLEWQRGRPAVVSRRARVAGGKPVIYVASPYAPTGEEPESVMRERSAEAGIVAGMMLRAGVIAIAPVPYFEDGAQIYHAEKITPPQGWHDFDLLALDNFDALVVLTMDGWDRSHGVKIEGDRAVELGMPVRHLAPSDLFGLGAHEQTRRLVDLEQDIIRELDAPWPKCPGKWPSATTPISISIPLDLLDMSPAPPLGPAPEDAPASEAVAEKLPPVYVYAKGDGSYGIVKGRLRARCARARGQTHIDAVVLGDGH